jgi:hypothetical protein
MGRWITEGGWMEIAEGGWIEIAGRLINEFRIFAV